MLYRKAGMANPIFFRQCFQDQNNCRGTMCVRSLTLNVSQFEQPFRNHNQLGRLSATPSPAQWMLIIGTHVANVCSAEQNTNVRRPWQWPLQLVHSSLSTSTKNGVIPVVWAHSPWDMLRNDVGSEGIKFKDVMVETAISRRAKKMQSTQ